MNNMGLDPGTVFGLAVAGIGFVFMQLVFGVRVRMAESLYLAQRGLIDSPAQLADQLEKQIKTGKV